MPRIDAIAHGLADEMRTERPAPQPVLLEELSPLAAVRVVGERTIRHRVPATEVQKVKARLWRVTVIRVYVRDHLVGRARLRP